MGETSFAGPIASGGGVGRIGRDEFGKPDASYAYGGEDYAVHDLGGLVGHGIAKAEGQLQMPVLLIRSGDLRIAVAVDQIVGSREIVVRSDEHTSELQSLMRISYAVFCLKKTHH